MIPPPLLDRLMLVEQLVTELTRYIETVEQQEGIRPEWSWAVTGLMQNLKYIHHAVKKELHRGTR
jgi:hypothetical protein